MHTHYDNLQVSRKASQEVIKAAYKALAQKLHPDKNPEQRDLAAEQFGYITESYERLSDPKRRAEYDEFLASKGHIDHSRIVPGAADSVAMALVEAWIQGRLAAENGAKVSENPYEPQSPTADLWESAFSSCPKVSRYFSVAKRKSISFIIVMIVWIAVVLVVTGIKFGLASIFH